MKSIEESIAASMDHLDPRLLPFLPYILQDWWEIGASPAAILELVRGHAPAREQLHVLDLACGKGAVSVRLASKIGCRCRGVDAMEPFIAEARRKAEEHHVSSLCVFETGDIREKVNEAGRYDVIVLAAAGPVLGSYFETLSALSRCLVADGIIVIDDAYTEEGSTHPSVLPKDELLGQVRQAGMTLLAERVVSGLEETAEAYDRELALIRLRCGELAEKHPENAALFEQYVERQVEEYDVLKHRVVCSTMLFGRS